MRFHLFDGFLDSFSCGLGRVRGHASKASFVGPRLCSCDTSIGSSHIVPLRVSRYRFLIITLTLFFELTHHDMLLRVMQKLYF
jgi:hypothetical protein